MRKDYEFQIKFSGEDGEWVATCSQLPSLSWLAEDPQTAFSGFIDNCIMPLDLEEAGFGLNDVEGLIRCGYFIKAVVKMRSQTGLGLKEARDACIKIREKLKGES